MAAVARSLPDGITDTQSYTWTLREAFIEVLAPLFPTYTIRRTVSSPIQTASLPVLGVYILPEKMTQEGDANAGAIRFIHDFQIGFSVIIAANDPDQAEQTLDAAWWTLMGGLWKNAKLTNMIAALAADDTRIESIMLGTRRFVFGNATLNNECPLAELQYEATGRYRSSWEPVITDDLEEINFKTGIKIGDTADEMAQRQQIERRYLFDISSKRDRRQQ